MNSGEGEATNPGATLPPKDPARGGILISGALALRLAAIAVPAAAAGGGVALSQSSSAELSQMVGEMQDLKDALKDAKKSAEGAKSSADAVAFSFQELVVESRVARAERSSLKEDVGELKARLDRLERRRER